MYPNHDGSKCNFKSPYEKNDCDCPSVLIANTYPRFVSPEAKP